MARDYIEIIMNPVRQRIIQYLIVHKTGTAGEIEKGLADVPRASLYRHLKLLAESSCIAVAEERRVRGTIEKTYALGPGPANTVSARDTAAVVQSTLLWIMGSFAEYFEQTETDPIKDMLSVSTATLLLTDEEMTEVFRKIGETIQPLLENHPDKNRRERHITLISSPPRDPD